MSQDYLEILKLATCKKLKFPIDIEALQQEVIRLSNNFWLPHGLVQNSHAQKNSNWFDISLTSSTGKYQDDHSYRTTDISACNIVTDICNSLPYTAQLIHSFQPATRCRLFKLKSKGVIHDHTDDNLIEFKLARIVIPILSDVQCLTIIEQREAFSMLPGECWFLNDSKVHRVENHSNEDRVVMVLQTYDLEKVYQLIVESSQNSEKSYTKPETTS
jgi:Aspartyl/Asparaginyl beta-hydroxylase